MNKSQIKQRKVQIQERIKSFCMNEPRSLKEISEMLSINKNTVRTVHLYPMAHSMILLPVNNQKYGRYTKYLTNQNFDKEN
jgi:hypothetical protein